MSIEFEVLMTNIRTHVHEYIEHVLVQCCKDYNLPFNEVRDRVFSSEPVKKAMLTDSVGSTKKPPREDEEVTSKKKTNHKPKEPEKAAENKTTENKTTEKAPENKAPENKATEKKASGSKKKKEKPPVQMCTACTKNGDPCKSKAVDTELFCKKHMSHKNPVTVPGKKVRIPKKKVDKEQTPNVGVKDLPKDEAEWFADSEEDNNEVVGTMAPDLKMTASFYPDGEEEETTELYEDESIIDDVSEDDYVLDE